MAVALLRVCGFGVLLVLTGCLPVVHQPFYEPQLSVGKNVRPRCTTGTVESIDVPITDNLKANVRLFRRLDNYNHWRSYGYATNESPPSPDELYVSVFFVGKDVKSLRFASEAFVLSDVKNGRRIDLRQSFNIESGKRAVDQRSLSEIASVGSSSINLSFLADGFAPQEIQMQFPIMVVNGQVREIVPIMWIYRNSGVGLSFLCS